MPRDPSRAACPSTTARADAWLDGELSAGAAAALDGHVRGCAACRAHVEALGRLVAAVRRQRTHEPSAPASLRARVRAAAARWHETETVGDAVRAASARADARAEARVGSLAELPVGRSDAVPAAGPRPPVPTAAPTAALSAPAPADAPRRGPRIAARAGAPDPARRPRS
jgi:hypothetical protein